MGLLDTLKATLKASTQSTNRGNENRRSKGAYWCHDCGERILDVDVDDESPPVCPACGDEMSFERSPGSTGCAC